MALGEVRVKVPLVVFDIVTATLVALTTNTSAFDPAEMVTVIEGVVRRKLVSSTYESGAALTLSAKLNITTKRNSAIRVDFLLTRNDKYFFI